jgi:predicted nucleic acid-binding protein
MRVVLDTNILVSALMIQVGHPAAVYRAWQEGYSTLLSCAEQLEEWRARCGSPQSPSASSPIRRVVS